MLQELRTIIPDAPIFTSVFDPRGLPDDLREWPVRTTFLRRLPIPSRFSRALLPLMPSAFAALDLESFDVVLSISSAFSKNVNVRPGARHVCYCLTPPRYLWDLHGAYLRNPMTRAAAMPLTAWLRRQDRKAAAKVHDFIAISNTVSGRVNAIYGRPAPVIYPPVDTERFARLAPQPAGYLLVVSRLIRYKRIDLAIRACTRLNRRLLVVGTGPMRRELEADAGPSVEFLGPRSDSEIDSLMAGCDGFVFPGLEDFGIAPVEAQAAGRPVIAYGHGGAAETVRSGATGVFFEEQSEEALVEAIERFDRMSFDPEACRTNARRFEASVFRTRMESALLAAAARGTPSAL